MCLLIYCNRCWCLVHQKKTSSQGRAYSEWRRAGEVQYINDTKIFGKLERGHKGLCRYIF